MHCRCGVISHLVTAAHLKKIMPSLIGEGCRLLLLKAVQQGRTGTQPRQKVSYFLLVVSRCDKQLRVWKGIMPKLWNAFVLLDEAFQ